MKKFIAFVMVCSLMLCNSLVTEAHENGVVEETSETVVFCEESELSISDYGESGDIEITPITLNTDMTDLEQILSHSFSFSDASLASINSVTADNYEPNNTVDTAYNYDFMPEMSGNLYINGLKNASLHTVEDEDWYYTNLTAGNIYFMDLRNIGSTPNFNITLFFFNEDGTFDYLTSIGDTRFADRPEKYYYFQPNKSGRYYVCITGDGINTSSMYYYFYIGTAQRSFTYSGPIGTMIPILGNTYQTGRNVDLSGTVVPKDSIVLSMSFSNDFSGTVCSECQKKVVAEDGSAYYSSSTGGTSISNIAQHQYLDQVWSISARCTRGTHVTSWTPRITSTYSCVMQPYPGNEVN